MRAGEKLRPYIGKKISTKKYHQQNWRYADPVRKRFSQKRKHSHSSRRIQIELRVRLLERGDEKQAKAHEANICKCANNQRINERRIGNISTFISRVGDMASGNQCRVYIAAT